MHSSSASTCCNSADSFKTFSVRVQARLLRVRYASKRAGGVAAPLKTDAMNRTVDLVIAGTEGAVLTDVCSAVVRGLRVLVVLRSGGPAAAQRVRRAVLSMTGNPKARLTVMASADVVCVDGVEQVEAVVIRYPRTGRMVAVNASGFIDHSEP